MRNMNLTLPKIMGILNVTPDSFSDGGMHASREAVLKSVEVMQAGGADIVDIGGESTRPGAHSVSLDEELSRVMPVIDWVREVSDLCISIDTSKTAVMFEALKKNIDIINDVNALQAEGAVELLAKFEDVKVCLMHKQGDPLTMQMMPEYDNLIEQVKGFLSFRVRVCLNAGIMPANIWLDPGFGFGKTVAHNVELFANLEVLQVLGCPVLVGVSRKSMIGALQGGDHAGSRLIGSVAAAIIAMQKGASVLRVHDVAETVQALRVAQALA